MRIHDSETAYNLKKKPIKESLIALLWNKIRPSLKYVPALSIFLIAIFFLTSKTDSFNTKIGEEKVYTLADGSKIYLNSVSNLNVDKDYNILNRKVELKGEAYFEVEKGTLPFIIKTEYGEVTVLGTSFNLKNRSEIFELGVTSGSVKFTSKVKSYNLEKGQELQISENYLNRNRLKKTYTDYPSWRYDKIFCDQKSLKQISLELERKFDISFTFSDPKIEELTITGIIDINNLKTSIRAIKTLSQRTFKFDGENCIIL
jgi:ferric-dicitrate binding protein FerR (iron transport regulator)